MKKYVPRPHAVDRALLRFGISSEHAENWFNTLMGTARYVGKNSGNEVYDHKGKRIIVRGNEIVTVMKSEDLPFGGKISKLVERELKKAKQQLTKNEREISILIAELSIEKAILTLNYLKAKAPSAKNKNKALIEKTDARISELSLELEREKDEFNALNLYSSGYLISEVAND